MKTDRISPVWYFRFLSFVQGFASSWFATTYTLMLEAKGLNFWELMLPNVWYHLVMGVVDPATGYLGDIFGHVKIFLYGLLIYAVGDFVYFFATDQLTFGIAEAIVAIGSSLMSDALETWMRNKCGNEKFHFIDARMSAMLFLTVFPAMIGSVAAQVNRGYPFLLSAINSLVGALVGLALYGKITETIVKNGNHVGEKATKIIVNHMVTLAKGIWDGFQIPEFRFGFLVNFTAYGAYKTVDMLWSIVLAHMFGTPIALGFVWFFVKLAYTYGAKKAEPHKNPTTKLVALSITSVAIPIFVMSVSSNMWVVSAAFVLHEIGRAFLAQILPTFVNYHIEPDLRATLNSTLSSARWFGGALIMLLCYLLGAAGIITGPQQFWGLSTICLALLGIFVTFKYR